MPSKLPSECSRGDLSRAARGGRLEDIIAEDEDRKIFVATCRGDLKSVCDGSKFVGFWLFPRELCFGQAFARRVFPAPKQQLIEGAEAALLRLIDRAVGRR